MKEKDRRALFSSGTDDWETPDELFSQLNEEFGFTLDVCCNEDNCKCMLGYPREDDGLIKTWRGGCWMNPPYSEIAVWMKKAYEEGNNNAQFVVCLIPSRTDTRWWHDYVMKADEIRFIKGRLRFKGAKNSAPFPSAIVIFRKHNRKSPLVSTLEVKR